MKIDQFVEALQSLSTRYSHLFNFTEFSKHINLILNEKASDSLIRFTKLTIFFEAFYNSIQDVNLKKDLLNIRQERWSNHFGTPTLNFLITYQKEINEVSKNYSENNSNLAPTNSNFIEQIEIKLASEYKPDLTNDVVIDVNACSHITMPDQQEAVGTFVKTHNPIGGFTTAPCDPYSQEFIDHAASIANRGGSVLEIGAAFGAASLEALSKGAVVYCNDIEPQNLAVIRNRYLKLNNQNSEISLTGDDKQLVLIPGSLPDELSKLPKGFFDAILICRVLHFFPGYKIEEALRLMGSLLKPGGKLFIVCETPFLKNWQRFIPEHNKRLNDGVEWPGEINNPAEFESSGRAASLPKFVHWITKEVIERSFSKIGFFKIESASYIDRKGQFPMDLLLDGKESIGVRATKL